MSDVEAALAAVYETCEGWLKEYGPDSPRGVGWHDAQMRDLEGWAVWCSQNLPGTRVALRMGPPLDDFTVFVRRAPEP